MNKIIYLSSILIISFLCNAPAFSKAKEVNNGKGASLLAKCILEGGTLSGKSNSKCCSTTGSSSYCISCPEKKADQCTVSDGIFPVDQHSRQTSQPSTPVRAPKVVVVQTAQTNNHPVDSTGKKIDEKLCKHTGGTYTEKGPLTACINGDGTTTTVCDGQTCVTCTNGDPECKYIGKEHSRTKFPKPLIQTNITGITAKRLNSNGTGITLPESAKCEKVFAGFYECTWKGKTYYCTDKRINCEVVAKNNLGRFRIKKPQTGNSMFNPKNKLNKVVPKPVIAPTTHYSRPIISRNTPTRKGNLGIAKPLTKTTRPLSKQQQTSIVVTPNKKKNEIHKGVLLFDEADSLFSKRVEVRKKTID